MKSKTPKPGDLIVVRWEDAQHISGDWSDSGDPTPRVFVETVGWLISLDNHDVRLAAQVEPVSQKLRCMNIIPRGMIESMTRLHAKPLAALVR